MNLKELLFFTGIFLKDRHIIFALLPAGRYILIWPYYLLNIEICPSWLLKS